MHLKTYQLGPLTLENPIELFAVFSDSPRPSCSPASSNSFVLVFLKEPVTKMQFPDEVYLRKKQPLPQIPPSRPSSNQEILATVRPVPLKKGQKGAKRNISKSTPPLIHQPERSTSDSVPDSVGSNEYRVLGRKYLLLEEESSALGAEMKEAEDQVKALEDEKLALLDQLLVLEGLIDPSELK